MSFAHLFIVLRARLWLVLITFLVTVGTAVVLTLLSQKMYTATASVVIDFKGSDPLLGSYVPAQLMPGYMATQVDIIQSENVAKKVVELLKVADSPGARQQFMQETGGAGQFDQWFASLLLKKLDVKPSRDSSVVMISFTGADPRFAAAVANAFAQAYMDTNLELRVEPAKRTADWFSQRSRALRQDLEKAQSRLSDYQRTRGIVAVEERLDTETAKLDQLTAQLSQLQGSTVDASTRTRLAAKLKAGDTSALDELPDVLLNPLIQGLKGDIVRQQGRVEELSSAFGKNHPQYMAAAAQLRSAREKLVEEMNRIAASLSNAAEIAQRRESDMRAAAAAQKAKVLELKKQREELTVLVRESEGAQRIFEETSRRLSQTSLESQASITNIAMLDPASPPGKPSSPKVLLNVALGVFLGLGLGVLFAFLMELIDHRLRTVTDIETTLPGLPVLAHLPKARIKRRRLPSFPRLKRLAA